MKGRVAYDYQLSHGGPVGPITVIATFSKGENLTIVRVSEDNAPITMYKIEEHPEIEMVSWRILLQFVRDFS